MTPCERALAAIRHQPVDRVPYVEHLFDPRIAIALAKGAGPEFDQRMLDACPAEWEVADPEECLDWPPGARKVGLRLSAADAWISRVARYRDNIVYWPALQPAFEATVESKGGSSRTGLIRTRADIDRMRLPTVDDAFFAPAEAFVAGAGDFAACAMVFLGIDPTWRSMGFENFCVSLGEDPALVEAVLERFVEWTVPVVKHLCAMGFDFLWMADDIAFNGGPMFSPRMYHNLLLPYTLRIAEAITIPWIYHSDGDLMPIMDDLLSQGMAGLHPLEPGSMDPVALKKRYGDRIALVGNINIDTLTLGTPEQVREEVRQRIAELSPGGGYLVSSSNSVTEYCRPENVRAMIDAVVEFGRCYG
jgi:hypothetical protein